MADKVNLLIGGLGCQHCVDTVQNALKSVSGVETAQVDLSSGRATVTGQNLNSEDLVNAVKDSGYQAKIES